MDQIIPLPSFYKEVLGSFAYITQKARYAHKKETLTLSVFSNDIHSLEFTQKKKTF